MTSSMPLRLTLQTEGAAIGALACFAYSQTGAGWLMFAVLLLLPDVAMLGYLLSKRMGALCYNLAHSYLAPAALGLAGVLWASDTALAIALIWTAHIGFDRALGYGLKYASGFKETHIARV